MPRMKFILNPAANRGDTGKQSDFLHQLLARQMQAAREDGLHYEPDWVTTEYRGHAVELAHQAAKEGYDVVVSVGGDGTTHEIINGLMRSEPENRPRLGIIPVGSGNDFAFNVGLSGDLEEAARCLFSGKVRLIDVGTIADGSGRKEYWNNTIGIGFSGIVNILASKVKRLRGLMVYFKAVLETIFFHLPDMHIRVKADDQEAVEHRLTMLSVCNGPREGGGFPVVPGALVDDGLISFLLMQRVNRLQTLYFLPIVMAAKHLKHERFFKTVDAKRLQVTSDHPLIIHTDGEIYAGWDSEVRQLEFTMIPSAIELLCQKP